MGGKRVTFENFVDRARRAHGPCYTYDSSTYTKVLSKTRVICQKHGEFWTAPAYHMTGVSGCPDCGRTKQGHSQRLTTEDFIQRAHIIHSGKYVYDKVALEKSTCQVVITCGEHGDFTQTANSHLQGRGCEKCRIDGARRRYAHTTEKFIIRANAVHQNRFGYSKVHYVNKSTPVEIICSEHGSFFQGPHNHLKGSICPDCAFAERGLKLRLTEGEFFSRAQVKHSNRFDYSEVEYVDAVTPVRIVCSKHGPYEQTPKSHLSASRGCPQCGGHVSRKETAWLDSLGVILRQFAILIPGRVNPYHADGFDGATNTVYAFHGDYWHGNPKIYDPSRLNPSVGLTFGELYDRTMKTDQQIRDLGFNLVAIWEAEWDSSRRMII